MLGIRIPLAVNTDLRATTFSSTLYLLWLALKSATTFLFTASSTALPPLCVHSFSVVTSPDVTAPLPDAPDEQATSPTAAPAASAATPRGRELFQGMVVPSSVPARTEPVGGHRPMMCLSGAPPRMLATA